MKEAVSECPLEKAVLLISGRWRALIIYYLSKGPMRFNELKRANAGISHRMLSLDLRELEAGGVIARTVIPTVPPQVEYRLTAAGEKLVPLIDRLGDWWEETHRAVAEPHRAVA
jgi:DNA-binding HxlR family transcriptional regulator